MLQGATAAARLACVQHYCIGTTVTTGASQALIAAALALAGGSASCGRAPGSARAWTRKTPGESVITAVKACSDGSEDGVDDIRPRGKSDARRGGSSGM
jgi:hypothetical protein